MSTAITDPFEAMIRDAGEDWLLDWYAPPQDALPHLREILRSADDVARERLGGNAPRLTPEALVTMYAENPHKVRAFLQVLGSVASPHMLVMVWRILHGMGIEAIRMGYDATEPFHLYVRLSSPYAHGTAEEYESSDIDDAVVLRHLGTLKMGNQGIFDGFYAFNLSKNSGTTV